jgi:pseudouridine synthase
LSFRNKLQNLLVVKVGLSHKQAKAAIENGEVHVQGKLQNCNCEVLETHEVVYKGQIIQIPKTYKYYKYYKPLGIECSMRTDDKDALGLNLPEQLKGLQVCGRLDKASEGLLIFTDDGKFLNKITSPRKSIWKTYLVWLESEVDEKIVQVFEKGIILQRNQTLPAKVKIINSHVLEIGLQEGRNKQIRRMSFEAGNFVTKLIRTSIGEIELNNLESGFFETLTTQELEFVRKIVSICL